MVDKGLLDMGIVREPVNSQYFERIRLQEDSWIAYIPNRNPLSQKNRRTIEIELADLRDEPLILPSRGIHEKQIKTWFEMIGAEPRIVCWYSSLVNGMALVKNGLGTMLCPKSAQSILDYSCAAVKEIVNPTMTTGSVIVWKNFHNLSETARRFIDYVKTKELKDEIKNQIRYRKQIIIPVKYRKFKKKSKNGDLTLDFDTAMICPTKTKCSC